MSNSNTRKSCVVPKCTNTTINAPHKLFLIVPKDIQMRKKWIKAMKRLDPFGDKSTVYCCEDHFDVKEDVSNYIKYETMAMNGKQVSLRLKKGVVPHKFECQRVAKPKPKSRKAKPESKQSRKQVMTPLSQYESVYHFGTKDGTAKNVEEAGSKSAPQGVRKSSRKTVKTKRIGNISLSHLPPETLKSKYMCVEHFENKYRRREKSRKRKLKKLAVPVHYKGSEFLAVPKPVSGLPSSQYTPLSGPTYLTVLTPQKVYSNKRLLCEHADEDCPPALNEVTIEQEDVDIPELAASAKQVALKPAILRTKQYKKKAQTKNVPPKIGTLHIEEIESLCSSRTESVTSETDEPSVSRILECDAMITRVYHYLEKEYHLMRINKKCNCDLWPLPSILRRTAEATGVTQRRVSDLLCQEEKNKRVPRNTSAIKSFVSLDHCYYNRSIGIRPNVIESISYVPRSSQTVKMPANVQTNYEDTDPTDDEENEDNEQGNLILKCEVEEEQIIKPVPTYQNEPQKNNTNIVKLKKVKTEPINNDYIQTVGTYQNKKIQNSTNIYKLKKVKTEPTNDDDIQVVGTSEGNTTSYNELQRVKTELMDIDYLDDLPVVTHIIKRRKNSRLTPEHRKLAVNVFKYVEKTMATYPYRSDVLQKTAEIMSTSRGTISNILREHKDSLPPNNI